MKVDEDRTYQEWNGWRITLCSKQRGIHVKAQCIAQPDRWVGFDKLFNFRKDALVEIQRLILEAEANP